MRVNVMVDGELMGFEGDAAKVIKARDDEIGVLRHVVEGLEGVMAERKPISISRELFRDMVEFIEADFETEGPCEAEGSLYARKLMERADKELQAAIKGAES